MAVQLERFTVKDETRGSATLLATFNVNLGPFSLNGFELVDVGGKRFISAPHRRYQAGGQWKKYSYVWFHEGKGRQLEGEIEKLAIQEYDRRSVEQAPAQQAAQDPFSDSWDDDFPF